MISIDTAQSIILHHLQALDEENSPLVDSIGRVLSSDLTATTHCLVGTTRQWMACRQISDLSGPDPILIISDEIAAGDGSERPFKAQTAVRIFTGAPVPPGADTVVIQENCRVQENRVCIHTKPNLGANIRKRGSDLDMGDIYLKKGRVLTAGDISLAASQGRDWLPVHRRASVAIVTTGNELIEPKEAPPARGQVVDGNSIALAGCVQEMGGLPHRPAHLSTTLTSFMKN